MKLALLWVLFIVNTAFAADVSIERYLIVEDEISLPNGQVLGQFGVSLIHWQPDIISGQVAEAVHIISKRRDNGQICADSKDMLLTIDGSKVTISEKGRGIIGSGALDGTGWNWNSLNFEVQSDGHTVTGIDYFGSVEWTSQKNVLDSKGNVSIKVAGRLRPITKDTFHLLSPRGLPSCH